MLTEETKGLPMLVGIGAPHSPMFMANDRQTIISRDELS